MRILTDIGEIGVACDGRCIVLRPSLAAMASLGEPAEIVQIFARAMEGDLMDCLAVVFACSEEDVSDLFGYIDSTDKGLKYIPGKVSIDDMRILAQALLRHGVIGVAKELPRPAGEEPQYLQAFEARELAAVAMAHLQMAEAEAWNMTMTGLVGTLRVKFPPSAQGAPGYDAPSIEEHDAAMQWYERVEAARAAQQGTH